jgi:peroxiredoxin
MVGVGQEALPFTLPDAEFRPFALKAYRGRPVLLAFFPAAFSPVCVSELAELQKRLPAFEAAGVLVAGISVDGPYALLACARQYGITFPLLSDFHREVIRAYGVEDPDFLGLQGVARRAVFLIDGEGTVRYKWVAQRPRHEPNYEQLLRVVQGRRG